MKTNPTHCMIFPGYHPTAYIPGAHPDPPTEVPLSVFQAAVDAGATHLSADGQRAYERRFGRIWQSNGPGFKSWWNTGGDLLPADAVIL